MNGRTDGNDRVRFSWRRAVFWAVTWGVGVAAGVAGGAWLSAISGAGAPGVSALDPGKDLLALPAIAGVLTLAVHLAGQVARAWRRGKRAEREAVGEPSSVAPE